MLVGLTLFALYPTLFLLALAASKSSLGKIFQSWVGTANFMKALGEANFVDALLRSVGFALTTTAAALLLGLGVALLLDRAVKARALLRTLILLPLLTPPVTVGIIWQLLLMPAGGLVNSWLLQLGLTAEPITFLGSPSSPSRCSASPMSGSGRRSWRC